jgi:hypothetical protein
MSSFRKPFSVLRTPPGHYDDAGNWVEGSAETLTISMSIQPLRIEEMDALPEGRRNSRAVKIYSGVELLPAEQTTGQNADLVTWQGKPWEVIGCDSYQMGVISHYKSLAVEVKAN